MLLDRTHDDNNDCGWATLLSRGPVLFCTDAETMLTPPQNHNIHRFRQALYLYFSGKDSEYLERVINNPNPAGPMYQLGFWAEATSLSREEQQEGIRDIEADLMPVLKGLERHDPAASQFFHQFNRIIVLEDLNDPTFLPARLASFLKLEGEQHFDNWVLLSYVPN
jgi:hypothetical protein